MITIDPAFTVGFCWETPGARRHHLNSNVIAALLQKRFLDGTCSAENGPDCEAGQSGKADVLAATGFHIQIIKP